MPRNGFFGKRNRSAERLNQHLANFQQNQRSDSTSAAYGSLAIMGQLLFFSVSAKIARARIMGFSFWRPPNCFLVVSSDQAKRSKVWGPAQECGKPDFDESPVSRRGGFLIVAFLQPQGLPERPQKWRTVVKTSMRAGGRSR